ncbi:MAG TPA: ATP-binding protein, partial [Alphaproteobacteria bacterium]|nr:ATP-binding protein [Alphaproteobacteria bacterium]
PFWLVNLAPAFLGVGLRTYALATLIGIIPGTLVYVSVGNGLGAVLDAGGEPDLHIIFRPEILLPIIGLAVLSIVPVIYRRMRRRKTDAPEVRTDDNGVVMPGIAKGLSSQLLLLTILFVMIAEVFIYVPSIAKFRRDFLTERLIAAQLATLALEATPDNMINDALQKELLATADVRAVILQRNDSRRLMLAEKMPSSVTAEYDLRTAGPLDLIVHAFETLARRGKGLIRVTGLPAGNAGEYVEIIFSESSLYKAMVTYSTNILTLSIIVSVFTASLLYMSVHLLFVRPMRQLATNMVRFGEAPEDVSRSIKLTDRQDEIGMATRELAKMQSDLRAALQQKTHLANLGIAVSKINHDLRNILASAQLVSDRLSMLDDPAVQRLTPALIDSIDRAIDLCKQTLKYGRAEERVPQPQSVAVRAALERVAQSLGLGGDGPVCWKDAIGEDFNIRADPDQLHRVLLNLCRNASEAIERDGTLTVRANRAGKVDYIEIEDTGPGLPPSAREHLFEPFRGGTRADSTGLGLSISRELMRAHGGDISVVRSDDRGTIFRISLPHGEA